MLPAPEAGGLTVSLAPDVPPCQPGAVPSTVELTTYRRAGVVGVEPTTSGFGDRRANQLRLTPKRKGLWDTTVMPKEKPPEPDPGGRLR